MSESVAEEYRASLQDLNFNSKPHINMLTMLAEENNQYAPLIVDTIVNHIKTVQSDLKLPSLYLIDSIMKNLGGHYIALFSKHVVSLFTSVFSKVDEATRSALYKLRQTWNEILSKNTLYEIDCQVNAIDPAWPITAKVPVAAKAPVVNSAPTKNAIHVNPKFLGGPAAQVPPPSRNQAKSISMKKNQNIAKDPEKDKMIELKKEQAEMLRMIEEKKMQLKALTQKKLEMAAKQKKKSAVGAVAVPQPNSEDKPLNHRDPRLKKNMLAPQSVESSKNTVPLQSVVVVPKLPSESNTNQIEGEVSKSVKKVSPKPEVRNPINEANHPVEKVDQGPKAFKEFSKDESSEKIHKENNTRKPVFSREHVNSRNTKFQNKKHPLSPEKKTMPSKMFCKDSLNKKRSVHSTRSHPENTGPDAKKGKFETVKVKIEPGTESHISTYTEDPLPSVHNKEMHPPDQRLTESYQGSRDVDYRHHPRNANIPKNKQWPQQGRRMHPRRSPNTFYSRDGNKDNLHISDQKYPPIKVEPDESLMRNKEFQHIDNLDKLQNVPEVDTSRVTVKTEIPDQVYNSKPILSHERLQPQQQPKTFMLDGKNRKLYFVNNRCFTLMDNNEPKEITFSGGPRNVHVDGLPKPLVLGFDGRPLEFETDGKRNSIHFGAPSREVYVNDYPYEAHFGGQPFIAILEDKKEHRIRIDGPPPQVVISEKPAFDLYEIYNRDKRISPIPPSMDPNLNNKGPESSVLQDIDMRSKPSHMMKSSILPESMKDVDWRRVPLVEGPKIPWNMPQDVPVASNMNCSSQPGMPISSHWDNGSNKGILSDTSSMERSNNAPWPHPAYRSERMPLGDRPLVDQPLPVNTQTQTIPPNSSWEMKPQTSLPPPPAIPLSLSNLSLPPNLPNLSSLSTSIPQMPNVSVPPPNWNPLPPPPMFTGSLPDSLKPVSLSSSTASSTTNIPPEAAMTATTTASLSTLPINVETIYEKLVAAGIITEKPKESTDKVSENTESNENTAAEKKENVPEEEIPEPEILLTPKSLRQFRPSIIAALYKGSQCATCGMRFKEIQSEQYSRHLDWHFRMNRREKDGAKKAYSRRLYYEIKDWIQFNEIEEAEERTPSYFELQADGDMTKNDEKEKIQSVPASECETEKCSVCDEQFQLFWVEEEEEWHLKHAVSHDGEAYHPMCYEDFKKATELAKKQAEEEARKLAEEEVRKQAEEEAKKLAEEEAKKQAEEEAKKQAEEEAKKQAEEEAKKQADEETVKEDEKATSSAENSLVEAKEEKRDDNCEKESPTDGEKEQKTEPESDTSDLGTKSTEEKPDEKQPTIETEPATEETMEVDAVEQQVPEVEEPVKEVKPEKTVVSSSDSELDNFEDEFRPPTPDPRFDIQPPIMKGTELSALCTIM